MSDAFYRTIYVFSWGVFATSARAVVVGSERMPSTGALLLAANHISWYDIPLLAGHSPRLLDFLAINELYQRPMARWFFNGMNGIRYNRSSTDSQAVRGMLARLAKGRVVAIFPEGRLCKYEDSLFSGQPLRPGLARLAMAVQAPVLPVVLWGTDVYRRFLSWMPVRRTRYGMAFGKPIPPPTRVPPSERAEEARRFEEEYRTRMCELRCELLEAMRVKA